MITTPIIESAAKLEKAIVESRNAFDLAANEVRSAYAYREDLILKLQQAEKNVEEKRIALFKCISELNGSIDTFHKEIKEHCEALKTI